MSTKNKIVMYTNENCNYCKTLKEELNKNNIQFKEKLIDKYQTEWNEIVNLTSMGTTPTIYYKDSYFIPSRDFFNPQQLMYIFENYEKSTISESTQILEKIKSLNANINIAFGRLDQLLRKIETKINTDEHKSTD